MTRFYNKFSELNKRRLLRHNLPKPEILLWLQLKSKQLGGHKFKKQYSVGRYVLDFYCPIKKVAIEIDGEYHNTNEMKEYDRERGLFIESFGIMILRFTNTEVENNIENVLYKIKQTLEKRVKISSTLSPP